jgi:hypothetical protein
MKYFSIILGLKVGAAAADRIDDKGKANALAARLVRRLKACAPWFSGVQ